VRPERLGPRPLGEDGWPNFLKEADRWILRILGIVPPKSLPHAKEVKIGEGRIPGAPDALVTLYVSAFPARFWRIEIRRKDHARFELNAGTVDLQKLWSTIELVCRGMLDVRITWPSDSQASCERLDQGDETPAPLPLVSLGQGEFTHDENGNPAPLSGGAA
jgi:hypothetical protein